MAAQDLPVTASFILFAISPVRALLLRRRYVYRLSYGMWLYGSLKWVAVYSLLYG